MYDVAVRLDARIKHHIVNAIAKELTDVAQRQLHTQTFSLRTLLNGFSGVAQKLKKRDHDDHHDKHSGKGRNKSDREGGSFFRKGTARSRSGTPTTISASGVVVEDTSIPLKDIPSSGLSSNAVPFHGGATDADTLPDDESVDEEEEAEGQL